MRNPAVATTPKPAYVSIDMSWMTCCAPEPEEVSPSPSTHALATETGAAAHSTAPLHTAINMPMDTERTALLGPKTDQQKAEAFLEYLDQMLQTQVKAGLSWGEIIPKIFIAILGFVSGMPNWRPAYDYGESTGGRAWGGFLMVCGAVSYCSFNTLSFLALIEAIQARKDRVSTEEGSKGKGVLRSALYGTALIISALMLSLASAFQAFKLNTNVSAYIFGAIDLITNTITNSLSLQKLAKLPALRIILKLLYGIARHPSQFREVFADSKKSWGEIYGFLKMCDLSEDDIANLKNEMGNEVNSTVIMKIIFGLGKEHSDHLDSRYYGYDKYLRLIPLLLACAFAGFAGWYYQLASFEAISFIFSLAGISVVGAIKGLTTFLSIILAFVPTYLEFYLDAKNLSAVYNALPEIASQIKNLFSDLYTLGFTETLVNLFSTDIRHLKESDLIFKHSKLFWTASKILLITTFFAWGQRAGAITKLDNIDGVTKEVVKLFNIFNNICYKSGAMWALTDSIGIGIVKRYGEKVLAEAAKFISALRKFADVTSDASIAEVRTFLEEWTKKFSTMEADIDTATASAGAVTSAETAAATPSPPQTYNPLAYQSI